jgi:hypothetical protein
MNSFSCFGYYLTKEHQKHWWEEVYFITRKLVNINKNINDQTLINKYLW